MAQNVLERLLEGSMKPTNLPLETLREITDNFSIDRIVGEGGFGTVYKGVIGNGSVAVKRIRSSMTIDQKLFRREVDSLMEVNHPNVVRFLGLCSHTVETPMKNPESRGYIYAEIRERLLCFEYISNGSLNTKITDELRGLEWDKRYQIIKGICSGLHYLHMEKHILHMDLKPANVLLDIHMVPKITDFGLSRTTEYSQTTSTNHFSSPGYGAPENMFGHGRMSVKSDMYSLGVIIIELVTGHKGIPEDNNNVLRRWRHGWNKSAMETPQEYYQQVTKCIEIGSLCQKIDPYARPSISDIMSNFIEMESMNTHINNANKSTVGQMKLPYWEDDMLGVEPLELQFGYNKQKQILSCSVVLSNDTDGFIAFKMQTTSPLSYSVEPNKDIVKPRSKLSIEITLPAANTVDHKAAQQHRTNKQYTEEFIVRSIKVNEGLTTKDITEDMFEKHTTRRHVDEVHLSLASEEPQSKEVIEFPSNPARKHHTNSGTRPTSIEPRSVQLAIKNGKNAPLCEYSEKVMLELTGGDYSSDRPGLDLVVVLDTSHRMRGKKMSQLKMAMQFVIRKLSSIDRLSIVKFSDSAKKLCPLRPITRTTRGDMECLISSIIPHGGTNIMNGLSTGLKVLADRKVSGGRTVGIMLMSHGQQSKGDATQVTVGNVPVYTFGFGADSDPVVLSRVAANSMGGTFSHVQDIGGGGLTMAFSQCLAGLLTVAVQDLELTVTAIGDESGIVKVVAGSYPQMKDHDTDEPGDSVTVRFGDLYSREVRKVIVDLRLPVSESERRTEILKVSYSYRSRSSVRQQFVVPHEMLMVWRTNDIDALKEAKKPAGLETEEARLDAVKMVKEATRMADDNMLHDAQHKLVEAHTLLEEQCNPLLRNELEELLRLFHTQETYEEHGRLCALSSKSSHERQRFATRGGDTEIARLFATPHMDKYLEQARKFHDHPKTLPSEDDDIKEEVTDPTTHAASREDETRRLSLNMEHVEEQYRPPQKSTLQEMLDTIRARDQAVRDSGKGPELPRRPIRARR